MLSNFTHQKKSFDRGGGEVHLIHIFGLVFWLFASVFVCTGCWNCIIKSLSRNKQNCNLVGKYFGENVFFQVTLRTFVFLKFVFSIRNTTSLKHKPLKKGMHTYAIKLHTPKKNVWGGGGSPYLHFRTCILTVRLSIRVHLFLKLYC